MTMVVNKIVVCPICRKKTFLRIQCGGYINSYPIRLNCINCRALLKGQFVMTGSERGVTMFNTDVLECDIEKPTQQEANLKPLMCEMLILLPRFPANCLVNM